MKTSTELFFSNLPSHKGSLSDLLDKEQLFMKIPSDWHIVISDIENSTLAIWDGQHHTQIVINKYLDHLPLHRQMDRFKRHGVNIPYSTISNLRNEGC